MAGFEGFEKRLELHFSCSEGPLGLGLRLLSTESLDRILSTVHCSIVSAVSNARFDAYVLSESSLFVYPEKVIIKTCGTTALLRALPLLLRLASSLAFRPLRCKYSRGSFIFPSAQPSPHTTFQEEVVFLDRALPSYLLRNRKASLLPSLTPHRSWHVYSASAAAAVSREGPITIEMCMTELDREVTSWFFRRKEDSHLSGHQAGREMTRRAGIASVAGSPSAFICDFAFDPCGYSMNGLETEDYSTIHVTPEDGYSYASFECVVHQQSEMGPTLAKVNAVFRPGLVSVSVTGDSEGWTEIAGLRCRSRAADEFPGTGSVTYQTFVMEMKDDCAVL
ncbi:hypothetical protein HPP92_011803 [Vanilla planifolia]|uniref:S-adenosylmethionine decarboxylase proenzyme n=1 Tax=Vanilla planifolia TaxID=51239 RepID=A0A835R3M0_VANPL|nr:hypothetical protein HPP92_011803 [Vanilla planifolia]